MYNNNNYLKCPICKVVFSQKYIKIIIEVALKNIIKYGVKNNIIKRSK